ncbi:MAG TPA: acyl-[acyl-carrier-protein]--UDP-N-acetylglucosamine O-acyltransferase, partial [Psychrobacter sp.]|nr:acyl-[acyl-carrier-protein]--UDP-N-acetylglucosamine O-acyltransferase [Psychrobacter sp.]
KLIFKSRKTTEQVIEELTKDYLPQEPKIELLIQSLVNSKRGITR